MVVAVGEDVGAVVATVDCVVRQFVTDQSRTSGHIRRLAIHRESAKENELTLVLPSSAKQNELTLVLPVVLKSLLNGLVNSDHTIEQHWFQILLA